MRKCIQLLLWAFMLPLLAVAQTPKRIHAHKMKNPLLIALITLFVSSLTFAQDTLKTSYFPYQPGDMLIYHVTQDLDRYADSKITFVRDSVGENGDRHLLIEYEGNNPIATGFKVDTSGNVFAAKWWEFPGYWKVFDTSKGLNEPWISFQYSEGYELGNIKEVFSDEIFGISSQVMVVHIYSSEDSLATWGYERNATKWKSGIGITEKVGSELGPTYTLKGALIDGIVYGDTALVLTSTQPEPDIPKGIALYQNYPNPFNPTTNITFTLPTTAYVSLVVYDLLGREVTTLVNSKRAAGEQTIRFDASSLANGIYLYQLQTAHQVITKKMTLIK